MDISLNACDAVTLEYLINPAHYDRFMKKNDMDADTTFRRDRRFYKRRLFALVKDLFNKTITDMEITVPFNHFLKESIQYLKFKDLSETLQQEYANDDNNHADNDASQSEYIQTDFEPNDDENDNNNNNNNNNNNPTSTHPHPHPHPPTLLQTANSLCMKQPEVKKITMDQFVIVKNKPSNEKLTLPQRKEINLRDPKFRNPPSSRKKASVQHHTAAADVATDTHNPDT